MGMLPPDQAAPEFIGKDRDMLRMIALIAALLIVGIPADGFAKSKSRSGGNNENDACFSSVRRFCRGVGSDQMSVLACLQQNRSKISPGCRKVLESHGV